MKAVFLFLLLIIGVAASALGQTLNLPPRPVNTPTGSQFATIINSMSQTTRENWILGQVQMGNVPSWMTNLVPITTSRRDSSNISHTLTYYVAPDYLAIGSDQDYFLEPTTPILAQRIANFLHCSLPTRLMVNYTWTNAAVKLEPSTVAPTNNNNATVAVFLLQDKAVMAQRNAVTNAHPLGALVSGDKKDIVVSTLIYTNLSTNVPHPVVIYGWMHTTGVAIQGEVNVHDESYMDYSHGVRLVQMNVLLDGATNTITNILSDPVLCPLLSDEGVMAKPYYTIDNTIAPFFINQPFSQTAKIGANVAFNAGAYGDAPMAYQWKLNGANITGATNATLTITNAQSSNAGTYSLGVTNPYGTVSCVPAVLKVTTNAFSLLFNDALNTDTSTNWNLFAGSDTGAPDFTTNWAFNYGGIAYTWNGTTYTIPPAPNTTDGMPRSVKLTVNNSNAVDAAVNLYPRGQSFNGNFALKFDMWINYPGGVNGAGASGTTEFVLSGIDHSGTKINWATTNVSSTDGLWFAVDGEGGSSRDYRAYSGNPSGTNNDFTGTPSGLAGTIHTAAIFQTLFPSTRFESAGVPGKNWVAGEIDQTNGVLIWKLDGTIVAQRTNTSVFTNGNIMLGYMDIFPTSASPLADAFLLFANVRVEDWSSSPIVPAAISAQPQAQTIIESSNATFTVSASGIGLTYQWLFNGTAISGATNAFFTLSPVTSADAGSYSVTINNLAGTIFSSTAQLSVSPAPLKFNAISVLPECTVQLIFTAPSGNSFWMDSSSNLVDWNHLASFQIISNPITYLDTNAATSNARFYRLSPF